MDELEPLKKLDAAICALHEAGYVFKEHSITDTILTGTYKDSRKRVIELRCYKEVSGSDYKESPTAHLVSFSTVPLQPPDIFSFPR